MSIKRIIIVGGGFGGVSAPKRCATCRNGAAVREDSLLERSPPRRKSTIFRRITLTAYRRTWLKVIPWGAAEGLALETLPEDRAGKRQNVEG